MARADPRPPEGPVSRREFLVRAGALSVGAGITLSSAAALLAACNSAASPGATSTPAPPTAVPPTGSPSPSGVPDLSGTGAVVVQDEGGAMGTAQRRAHFEPFELATGIALVANPGSDMAVFQAGLKAGVPAWDVWDCAGGDMLRWAEEGLLEKIDYSWFDPADKESFGPIPAHDYGVPNYYYATMLAYPPDKFGSTPPATWADMWDTTKFPGMRSLAPGLWVGDGNTFEIALLADGVDPKNLYPLDFDRAFASLDRIRAVILKWWEAGAEPVQLIQDGEVNISSAWNGRIQAFIDQGGKLGYSWEQALLQSNYWIVPKGAQNVENAMKYLAFVSRARTQARFSELIAYAPTVKRAFDFIGSERQKVLVTNPDYADKMVLVSKEYWGGKDSSGKPYMETAVERWEEWITSG